jgi:hypothetical protein
MARTRAADGKFAKKEAAGAPVALVIPGSTLQKFKISHEDEEAPDETFETDFSGEELEGFKIQKIREYAGTYGVDADYVTVK